MSFERVAALFGAMMTLCLPRSSFAPMPEPLSRQSRDSPHRRNCDDGDGRAIGGEIIGLCIRGTRYQNP
jgi:hypothetical protein